MLGIEKITNDMIKRDIFKEETSKSMEKADKFEEYTKKMADTYRRKNNDYGDSFTKVRNEYPQAICIRLMDKLERFKTLMSGNQQMVKDESIDDTLLDMANYCIMELVERNI